MLINRKKSKLISVCLIILLLCAGILTDIPVINAYTQVGIWDRFEVSTTNSYSYSNPYFDVTLNVTYTRPNGTTVNFYGFYDGGTTWKIRFMPDMLGVWSYNASFSDGRGNSISGNFECVSSSIPGMLAKDEINPMWFGFKGGKHTIIRSFHCADKFFADQNNSITGESWSPTLRSQFLDWAQSQGYNTLAIASHYLNRDVSGRGKGWNTPDLWNASTNRPNANEYRRMETVLNDLAARKMIVFPFAGMFGKESDFPTNQTQQNNYIKYNVARLGAYWNILYSVAGPEPNLADHVYLSSADVERLGNKIATEDVFGHLVSVHNAQGDDPYKNSTWSDYGVLQGPDTTNVYTMNTELLDNHHASKPLYASETLWPGNKNQPAYTDTQIRKLGYAIMMSATALNYADMNGNSSSGFSGTLLIGDKVQSRHDILKKIWDYFETTNFYRMSPKQNLVNTGLCLAEVGNEYLVYLPSGGSVNVTITNGSYNVQWVNARNTTDKRNGGTTSNGQNLTAPDTNDWLVRLYKSSLPTPTPTPSPTPVGTTLTFNPTDDAYLQGSTLYNNAELRVENTSSRIRTTYVKFNVSGLSGTVSNAVLKLKNTDTSNRTGTYKLYSGSHSNWTESNLSTSNAPAAQTILDTQTNITAGTTISLNVTSAITGNGYKTFVFKMDLNAGNDAKFDSSEGAVKPVLEVTTQ